MMKLKHNEAAIVFGAKGISLALPTGGKRGMVPSYCLSALALYHLLCSDEKLIKRVNKQAHEMLDSVKG